MITYHYFALRFVSTANIDDYSSGDSSFTTDDLKAPAIKLPRRFRTTPKYDDASFMGSDYNLSSSMGTAHTSSMFRGATLSNNRAVSCSDLLLEFSDKKKKKESPMVSLSNSTSQSVLIRGVASFQGPEWRKIRSHELDL